MIWSISTCLSTQFPSFRLSEWEEAGCNAVNRMYLEGIRDVDFIVANTDAQALNASPVEKKIQLGVTLTEGGGPVKDLM